VLEIVAGERALGEPLLPDLPDLAAEIVFSARFEDARSATDALARRTHFFWQAPRQGEEAVERAADLLARELAWTSVERRAAIDEYALEVERSRKWSVTGSE
jgi:glycerol-3-phosphate dehydrogenase